LGEGKKEEQHVETLSLVARTYSLGSFMQREERKKGGGKKKYRKEEERKKEKPMRMMFYVPLSLYALQIYLL